jgi:hypothetical protein
MEAAASMFVAKVVRCNSAFKAVRVSVQNMEFDKMINVVSFINISHNYLFMRNFVLHVGLCHADWRCREYYEDTRSSRRVPPVYRRG